MNNAIPPRSRRAGVRNPVLALAAIRQLQALPATSQAALRAVLLDLQRDSRQRADASTRRHKAPMAAYWKAVAVYAGHIARVLRPAEPAVPPPPVLGEATAWCAGGAALDQTRTARPRLPAGERCVFGPVVCMVGPPQSPHTWRSEYARLSCDGYHVLSVCWADAPPAPTEHGRRVVHDLRLQQIVLADWVWVVDPGGATDVLTDHALDVAAAWGKPIRRLSHEVPQYAVPPDPLLAERDQALARNAALVEHVKHEIMDLLDIEATRPPFTVDREQAFVQRCKEAIRRYIRPTNDAVMHTVIDAQQRQIDLLQATIAQQRVELAAANAAAACCVPLPEPVEHEGGHA